MRLSHVSVRPRGPSLFCTFVVYAYMSNIGHLGPLIWGSRGVMVRALAL